MPITYATYSEWTQVYSVKGVSQAEVNSTWIPYGALRVNEQLGKSFSTPFSSNNQTAKQLSIDYGYLGILLRTRNQTDSEELKNDLESRVADINSGNCPIILDDGSQIYPENNSKFDAFSTTQDYKSTFDMRDVQDQRVDPDYIDQLWSEDKG